MDTQLSVLSVSKPTMLTTLLILTTILLALAGLAIMKLANAYTALNAEYNELLEEAAQDSAKLDSLTEEYSEYKFDAYIREQTLKNAVEDAEMAFEQELKTKLAKLKIGYENRCIELEEELKGLNRELEHTKANSDSREQALIKALEELQEEHKAAIEGYETYTAEQAAEIAQLNQVIKNLQDEIASLTQAENFMASKIAKQAGHIIKIEAEWHGMSRHQLKLHKQITKLEKQLEAYYAAEADLTEAIEAAEEASTEPEEEEAPIHIDDKKAWICIGNWTRLIVYKHNIYQPYLQRGLGAKIERTKRSDLTTKAQDRYNALKAALKSL